MYNSKKIVKKARRLLVSAPEDKFHVVGGTLNTDSTGTITLLNGLQQGSDFDQRVGRRVEMRRLTARFLAYATAATGIDQTHRIIIVIDHQANGVAPAVLDILTSASVLAQHNPANLLRFSFLLDRTIYLNATGEAGSGRPLQVSRGIDTPCFFNSGVAGTVADITTNSVYLLNIGNVVAGATAGKLDYNVAVHFHDS